MKFGGQASKQSKCQQREEENLIKLDEWFRAVRWGSFHNMIGEFPTAELISPEIITESQSDTSQSSGGGLEELYRATLMKIRIGLVTLVTVTYALGVFHGYVLGGGA